MCKIKNKNHKVTFLRFLFYFWWYFPHHPQAHTSLIPLSTKLRYRTINRQNIKSSKTSKRKGKVEKFVLILALKKPPSSPVTKWKKERTTTKDCMNELIHRHCFLCCKRKFWKLKLFARHDKRAKVKKSV